MTRLVRSQERETRFLTFDPGTFGNTWTGHALTDVKFGLSAPNAFTERLLAQASDFGLGSEGTPGGRRIGEELPRCANELFPNASLDNMFASVYAAFMGAMREHPDKKPNILRLAFCFTDDGSDREIGLRDTAGGEVWYSRVEAGEETIVVSKPGEQERIPIKSGGGYAMSGAGAGAVGSWVHEVFALGANAAVIFVDLSQLSADQPAAMAGAVRVLQQMRPTRCFVSSLPDLPALIDSNTGNLNSSEVVGRALNYFNQLVANGYTHLRHADGSSYTQQERKKYADSYAVTLCSVCGFDGFEPPPAGVVCPQHEAPCVKGGAPPPQPPVACRAARRAAHSIA